MVFRELKFNVYVFGCGKNVEESDVCEIFL